MKFDSFKKQCESCRYYLPYYGEMEFCMADCVPDDCDRYERFLAPFVVDKREEAAFAAPVYL